MEKIIPTGEIQHANIKRACRAIAVLALSLSCFLTGCTSEKGTDTEGSSPAPYGSSETTTSQPENSSTENSSEDKKERDSVIDLSKNSIYYSEDSVREGFTAFCQNSQYGVPGMYDCSVYFCDGKDLVRFGFNNMDLIEKTRGGERTPSISDLLDNTNTLYTQYSYPSTEITKNLDKCIEKSSSVGEFTKPVSHFIDENEQDMCLPQFMTTIDGKKMGMKVTKTTSVNEQDNNGPRYPFYTLDTSEECFDTRFTH